MPVAHYTTEASISNWRPEAVQPPHVEDIKLRFSAQFLVYLAHLGCGKHRDAHGYECCSTLIMWTSGVLHSLVHCIGMEGQCSRTIYRVHDQLLHCLVCSMEDVGLLIGRLADGPCQDGVSLPVWGEKHASKPFEAQLATWH